MSSTADSTPTESPGPSDVRGVNDQRHRKSTSSTGGGRAWSNQEETYLIETRMHKMPYKHIAAHLKKTELACRLHYHQLSFGNKRHRRAASSSSFASAEHSPTSPPKKIGDDFQQRRLPSFSLPANSDRYCPPPATTAAATATDRMSTSPQSHIPILPKPIPYSHRVSQSAKTLRLITEDMGNITNNNNQKPAIDIPRLNRIYNIHRIHFWSMIAQNYGGAVCPSTLEDAWLHHQTQNQNHNHTHNNTHQSSSKADFFPPTPCGSPESAHAPASSSILNGAITSSASSSSATFSSSTEYSKGFTPINTPPTASASSVDRGGSSGGGGGSFAISSLLTEDREVRSPAMERR